jgi:hypothetical protein
MKRHPSAVVKVTPPQQSKCHPMSQTTDSAPPSMRPITVSTSSSEISARRQQSLDVLAHARAKSGEAKPRLVTSVRINGSKGY